MKNLMTLCTGALVSRRRRRRRRRRKPKSKIKN